MPEASSSAAVRVVVVADTHMRRGGRRALPPAALDVLATADLILHAGDVVQGEVLAELETYAPVRAVLGNNDTELVGALPETREVEVAGVRVAMVHDSGAAKGRTARLRRRFPHADVVVFGHSHIPWRERTADGQLHFNPGSPTERRRQPHHTVGVLVLADGRVVDDRIEIVDGHG